MLERGISKAETEQTLAVPLRKILAQNGRKEFQGWIERAGKQQLLRVLVEGNLVILVLTILVVLGTTPKGACKLHPERAEKLGAV